jgi:TolA-binding protein
MKRAFILLTGIFLLTARSWADDAKPPVDQAAFLEDLQLKLDHAAQRANQPSSEGSSVVGLRGSKQDSGAKQLYWKGKAGVAPVSTAEVKELRTAIELARAGNNEGAITGLKAFLEKYPKSALKHDAEETLARISPPPSVPAAPKP